MDGGIRLYRLGLYYDREIKGNVTNANKSDCFLSGIKKSFHSKIVDAWNPPLFIGFAL